MDIFNRRRRTRTPKVRTALSRSCPAGKTDNGQLFFENSGQNPDSGQIRDRQNPGRKTSDSLFYKNPDRIAPPDRIFRHRIGLSTKCIIQLPTLNPYWQIRETKSKNLDIIKRYLRKQDFAEIRFLSETSWYGRLKLEILIEITRHATTTSISLEKTGCSWNEHGLDHIWNGTTRKKERPDFEKKGTTRTRNKRSAREQERLRTRTTKTNLSWARHKNDRNKVVPGTRSFCGGLVPSTTLIKSKVNTIVCWSYTFLVKLINPY